MALVFGVLNSQTPILAICSSFECLSFAFDTSAFGNAMYCNDRHGLAFCFLTYPVCLFFLFSKGQQMEEAGAP